MVDNPIGRDIAALAIQLKVAADIYNNPAPTIELSRESKKAVQKWFNEDIIDVAGSPWPTEPITEVEMLMGCKVTERQDA